MNDDQIEKFITVVTALARRTLSEHRYEHSCRVAAFAEGLAQRYGYGRRTQRLCYLAGIAHDIYKEKPVSFLLRTVQADGQPVSSEERGNSALLHGRAAAVLLQERFGIHKKSLLHAVRYHTSASAKFDAVGKMLYIADKIEPGRKQCGHLRDKVKELSLDALFLAVLQDAIDFLESKGRNVLSCTYHAYRYMRTKAQLQGLKELIR